MEVVLKSKLFRWVFSTTLLVVLILALLPAKDVKDYGFAYDKLNHALAFFVLMLLARFAWPRISALIPVVGLLLLGGGIEMGQYVVGRDAALGDVVADGVGVLTALIILQLLRYGQRAVKKSAARPSLESE